MPMEKAEAATFIGQFVRRDPLAGVLVLVAALTHKPYGRFLEFVRTRHGITNFAPWDKQYVLHQIEVSLESVGAEAFKADKMEHVLRRTLDGLGFGDECANMTLQPGPFVEPVTLSAEAIHIILTRVPDVAPFGVTRDLYPRVICKVDVPGDGLRSYRVLLHECGHAIHFRTIKFTYQSLRLKMPVFYTEAIAKVFESLTELPNWLTEIAGMDVKDAREIRRLRSLQQIFVLRQNIVLALIEMMIAENPETAEQLPVLWKILSKQILYPEAEDTEFGLTEVTRLILHERSGCNSVLSEVLAAQIRGRISPNISDGWYSRESGKALVSYLEPGGSSDWQDVMRELTGTDLDGTLIAQELERGVS